MHFNSKLRHHAVEIKCTEILDNLLSQAKYVLAGFSRVQPRQKRDAWVVILIHDDETKVTVEEDAEDVKGLSGDDVIGTFVGRTEVYESQPVIQKEVRAKSHNDALVM